MKSRKLTVLIGVISAVIIIGSGCENNISSDNTKVTQTEQNIAKDNRQITKSVKIYYINEENGMIETKNAKISDEKDIWEQLQNTGIITEACKLLNFSLDESEKKINLNFNTMTGDRIRSMGTTGETEILACIINTYLDAYDCDAIKLTEEGKTLETSSGANFDGYSSRIEF